MTEQTLPPRGWDFCEWADATDVLTSTGGIYGVELNKMGQYVDSVTVDFEPGFSEIGTHQAKFCLGLKPIRRNMTFDKDDARHQESHVVTFDFVRERMADAVRGIAQELSVQAGLIEKGDLMLMQSLLDKFQHMFGDVYAKYEYLEANRGKTVTEETLLDL